MSSLILLFLLSFSAFASYRPAELLARYGVEDSWNAPPGMVCFSSEPLVMKAAVYLGCMDQQGGQGMVEWSPEFKVTAVAREDFYFSLPRASNQKVIWSEFDERSGQRTFIKDHLGLTILELNQAAGAVPNDSFLPLSHSAWVYRRKNFEGYELWHWENQQHRPLFQRPLAHLFPPIVGEAGELVIKTREQSNDESAPDKLWRYDKKQWHLILEDQDSNPASPWNSFRHQISLEGDKVLLVARQDKQDRLILWQRGRITEIARAGIDLKEFDYFTPKIKNGIIVFRGVDLQNRKALWLYDKGKLSRLITQGDLIKSDLGPARVHYPSQHAIFYGAPGIGPQGDIIQQATLTDPNHPTRLLGIGLLKFSRE